MIRSLKMNIKKLIIIPLTAGVLSLSLIGCNIREEQEEKDLSQLVEQQEKVKDKYNYEEQITNITITLDPAYLELHNLYSNKHKYQQQDWVNQFKKQAKRLENAYTGVMAIIPPKEYEQLHEDYLTALEGVLALNVDVYDNRENKTIDKEYVTKLENVTIQMEEVVLELAEKLEKSHNKKIK